ncbi:MAG: helix-turn-helix domain-containing protein [Chloroflexi bacterium]|nr:helix-turn-helix domain-containing protein [Chloroflexota bacterium]
MLSVTDIRKMNDLAQRLRARQEHADAELVERLLAQVVTSSGAPQLAAQDYLTTGQAARMLGVSLQTIKNWVASGELAGGESRAARARTPRRRVGTRRPARGSAHRGAAANPRERRGCGSAARMGPGWFAG